MSGGSLPSELVPVEPVKAEAIPAKTVVSGEASGVALVSRTPLSFWGGLDPSTGTVIDPRHDLFGERVSGKVLFFPCGKGSSSSSAVLLEAIRSGTAPAAIVNVDSEPILAIGSIVGRQVYKRWVPIAVVSREDFDKVNSGDMVMITGSEIRITGTLGGRKE